MTDILSTKELCERFGVTRQCINQWKQEGMPGNVSYGRWDVALVDEWVERNRGHRPDDSGVNWRTEKYKADTEWVRLRTRQREGELAELTSIGRVLAEHTSELRETVERWVAEHRSAEDQANARRLADQFLSTLESATRARARFFNGGEHPPTAPVLESRRLG